MKILTNVTLAACVGLSLGWMTSCSTEHTVSETTTTREVATEPAPAIVTTAPVVTEPAVVPPNATTSTTTQFNNGTVEKDRYSVWFRVPASSNYDAGGSNYSAASSSDYCSSIHDD